MSTCRRSAPPISDAAAAARKAARRSPRASRKARAIQTERYKGGHGIRTNAEADGELLEQVAPLDEPSRKLLTQATERFRSQRARLPPRAARRAHARRSRRRRRGEADPRGGGADLSAGVAGAVDAPHHYTTPK